MTIVHLVVDDKFIDGAIRDFEGVGPHPHRYVILEKRPPYAYLRSPQVEVMSAAQWTQLVQSPATRAVVLHSLPPHHLALVRALPDHLPVLWIGWGYDYYGLLADAFPDGLILPRTQALLRARGPRPAVSAEGSLQAAELSVARPYAKPSEAARAAYARVDLMVALYEEYGMLRRWQPWFRAGFVHWSYSTIDEALVRSVEGRPLRDRPDLLVGNSAFPANNHLEAFETIRARVDLEGRRVVVPLSYGDTAYADAVERAGRQLFGAHFLPLRDYMDRQAYADVLSSCGSFVMNHVRQQAVGNILIGALMGARLFLHPRNPVGRWLERQGIESEPVDRLHTTPMTAEEKSRQTAAIMAFAGAQARRVQTVALVERLLGVHRPTPAGGAAEAGR